MIVVGWIIKNKINVAHNDRISIHHCKPNVVTPQKKEGIPKDALNNN
jgi:hypothetical protein